MASAWSRASRPSLMSYWSRVTFTEVACRRRFISVVLFWFGPVLALVSLHESDCAARIWKVHLIGCGGPLSRASGSHKLGVRNWLERSELVVVLSYWHPVVDMKDQAELEFFVYVYGGSGGQPALQGAFSMNFAGGWVIFVELLVLWFSTQFFIQLIWRFYSVGFYIGAYLQILPLPMTLGYPELRIYDRNNPIISSLRSWYIFRPFPTIFC